MEDKSGIVIAIIGSVGSLVIAIGSWVFHWKQSRNSLAQAERARRIDRVRVHLESFDELASSFELLAREERRFTQDEQGKVKRDENGKLLMERRTFVPHPLLVEGLQLSESVTIQAAIASQTFRIHREMNKVSHILAQLDPSGQFEEEFDRLYAIMVNDMKSALDEQNLDLLLDFLETASNERRVLSEKIESLHDLLK